MLLLREWLIRKTCKFAIHNAPHHTDAKLEKQFVRLCRLQAIVTEDMERCSERDSKRWGRLLGCRVHITRALAHASIELERRGYTTHMTGLAEEILSRGR